MLKIVVEKNETEQRLDRFLKKYLNEASSGFIYKMLRKKNITRNGKRANPEDLIVEGDTVELYLSEETIAKFRKTPKNPESESKLDIVYEDENILLMNKPSGILSHSTGEEFEPNMVDYMIGYLIRSGSYVPRMEKTFSPAICNRLDRNTSGLLIGAKSYDALKKINDAIKRMEIEKYYLTIVKGNFPEPMEKRSFLVKDEVRNRAEVISQEMEGAKEIITRFSPKERFNGYTLLEVQIVTGRTHQIRSQLYAMGYAVIGDEKYGNRSLNRELREKYGLKSQWLHCEKLIFGGLDGEMAYLNGRVFEVLPNKKYRLIQEALLGGK